MCLTSAASDSIIMSSSKHKLTNKTVIEKYKAIIDLEQGMSNKDVANKHGVPRNTASTWFKNKDNSLPLLEKGGSNSKRKKLHDGELEDVDLKMWITVFICSFFVSKYPSMRFF